MRDLVEVLVVWAGPVGLFLACELQRLGGGLPAGRESPRTRLFLQGDGRDPALLEIFEALGVATKPSTPACGSMG
jgi:2-polyprenyl-6-methoxyphenol hydroxylase-like FAD-dependent oxidoreductase